MPSRQARSLGNQRAAGCKLFQGFQYGRRTECLEGCWVPHRAIKSLCKTAVVEVCTEAVAICFFELPNVPGAAVKSIFRGSDNDI